MKTNNKKVALITGASTGIGKEFAHIHAEQGGDLVVVTRSKGKLEELYDTNITVTALLPGATESEFAKTSGMDKTAVFQKTASARSVAEDGYNGMLAGKLDVVSGLTRSQKMMMAMIPFTPKKMLLKQIRQMQEV